MIYCNFLANMLVKHIVKQGLLLRNGKCKHFQQHSRILC